MGGCLLARALDERALAHLCTSKLPSRSPAVGHHGETPPPGGLYGQYRAVSAEAN
jgi:hypothetical protein